ncbi:hypothetical protein BDW60DRAFT_212739 [Aspergillus nidulans var. acristatus]
MATSAPQTLIRNQSADLTSPPSAPGLTPTIVSAKSKRRRHRHQRRGRERALRASLLAALPERPAPSDGEDNKLLNPTADTAADIDNNHINNSNVDSNGNNNTNSNTDKNNNSNNGNKSADKDIIALVTRIRLCPVYKTIVVVVDNTYTRKRRHVASPDLNNESDTTAATSPAKHTRAAPNPCLVGKLRNDIRALKNIAPAPASEMLISLDKFNNTLSAGADDDDPLGFLEAADNQEEEEEEGEEGEDDDEDDE